MEVERVIRFHPSFLVTHSSIQISLIFWASLGNHRIDRNLPRHRVSRVKLRHLEALHEAHTQPCGKKSKSDYTFGAGVSRVEFTVTCGKSGK